MHPFKNTLLELDENYYLRECYLKKDAVPPLSLMKEKMKPALAKVCAKMMTPQLKVQAGLEPPMKGGGRNWYMPPEELLAGRAVLKPIKPEHIENLSHNGIKIVGAKLFREHQINKKKELKRALEESDKRNINDIVMFRYSEIYRLTKKHSKEKSEAILQAYREFEQLYKSSVNKIEGIVIEAAHQEIERYQEEAYQHMSERLEHLVKCQANKMYEEYDERLEKEKARMKAEFIAESDQIRTDTAIKVHDINVEKHTTIEKLRHLLECQSTAGQIYVALQEKERCEQEANKSKHKHVKKIKRLKEKIRMKDYAIQVETEQKALKKTVTQNWKRKVVEVVKKFQIFVEYCLKSLPEQAEFFINLEKLMLIQISEFYESPDTASIIVEEPKYKDPVPQPHAFHLFCDKGYKPQFDQHLCPKRYSATDSQFPVIVINKKCVYSACDAFEKFADKVAEFLAGDSGDDALFEDNHRYDLDRPVKMMHSMKLQELKLESSIMNIIQQEFPNPQGVSIECSVCGIPFCLCKPDKLDKEVPNVPHSSAVSLQSRKKDQEHAPTGKLARMDELRLQREPKMESYINYVVTNKCHCAKTAKKHLDKYLPPYMKIMSPYEPPWLPYYEPCDAATLKALVNQARMPKAPPPSQVENETKDASTQYSDVEYEALCECFTCFKEGIKNKCDNIEPSISEPGLKIINESIDCLFLAKTISSFATDRTHSLRRIIDDTDVEELFRRSPYNFSSSN